jgi:hypothetical protein
VPARDVQLAARHADARTITICDRNSSRRSTIVLGRCEIGKRARLHQGVEGGWSAAKARDAAGRANDMGALVVGQRDRFQLLSQLTKSRPPH